MAEVKKNNFILKNILGDTKSTIDAIQKYLDNDSKKIKNVEVEEMPAASINRILNSTVDVEVNESIQQIINKI